MVANRLRALVVDDDPRILKLLAMALRQQGFDCECAADGVEAERLANCSSYDAVVTDLKMPNRNGHELICNLLKQPNRPLLIAYTGVVEPRLAKDLIDRGIDDILFKPVDLGFLASKVQQLIDRRRLPAPAVVKLPDDVHQVFDETNVTENTETAPISLSLLNHKLSDVGGLLPISSAAIDVFEMTRGCDWEISQIAAAIQRDASLAAGVLRLANSSLYNPTSNRVVDLDRAVARIGQKRIGELALTTSALAALTPGVLPWLDVDLTWKRSMAAGIVLEWLVEIGGHQAIDSGLMLSAIMHPLGRVALGMVFPNHYERMIASCEQSGESLEEQERRVFPTTHTEVMAQLLATWKVPSSVFQPLKFSLDDFRSLVRLSEPARTRTELVKVAIVLGSIAVGRWHDWDLVQLPSQALLTRLRVVNVGQIICQTRADVQKLAEFHPGENPAPLPTATTTAVRTAAYCDLSEANDDLLLEMLPSMGLRIETCSAEGLRDADGLSLVNGLETTAAKLAVRGTDRTVVVTDQDQSRVPGLATGTVVLPSSYGRLRAALLNRAGAEGLTACPA